MTENALSARGRRDALRLAALASVLGLLGPLPAGALDARLHFIAEAARMRDQAVAAGDQAYGAVLVLGDRIVGYGPSRVVQDGNVDAHAERVALWDAQRRLGRLHLPDAVIFATSQPCPICQAALVEARVARMFVGRDGADAGPPLGRDL